MGTSAILQHVKSSSFSVLKSDMKKIGVHDEHKRVTLEFGDLRQELSFDGRRVWVLAEVDGKGGFDLNNLVKFWYLLTHQSEQELLKDAGIILLHIYHKESEHDLDSKGQTWHHLLQKMKQDFGERFDAALFPVRFSSEHRDKDFHKAEVALAHVLHHGILPQRDGESGKGS